MFSLFWGDVELESPELEFPSVVGRYQAMNQSNFLNLQILTKIDSTMCASTSLLVSGLILFSQIQRPKKQQWV